MFKFLKNIFKIGRGAYFGSTNYELKNFFCGFGKCIIDNEKIIISAYKFKPSKAYPTITLSKEQITSITIEANPIQVNYKNDWIFIAVEHKEQLQKFIEKNNIAISNKNWVWDDILYPFLDTEFTDKEKENTLKRLKEKGISKAEAATIRNKVAKQMYKYNFDTMLWEWCTLGLSDVLQAMRVKYSEEEFIAFYNEAMMIENKRPDNQT